MNNVSSLDSNGDAQVFSTNDIGGIHFPKNKLVFGADATATDVSATNGLPVAPATAAAWVLGAGSAIIGSVSQNGAWNITNISGTVTLPTGASTSAKQPALGTAGSPSTDVISVQGIGSGTAIPVSNAGTFAVQAAQNGTWNIGQVSALIPGNGATNLGKAEDAAHSSGDTGVMALGVRRDTLQASSGNDGDYEPLQTDNLGQLRVTVGGGTAAIGSVSQNGTWNIGAVASVVHVDDNSGSLTVDNAGTFAVQAAQSGTWNVTNVSGTVSLPTGAATSAKQPALGTAGTPSTDVISVQGVSSGTPLLVSQQPATTGGLTLYSLVSAASANATNVKASAGQVYSIQAFNLNAAPCYLKLYNSGAAPTAGSGTPVKRLMIPGNTAGAGFVLEIPTGLAFSAGIGFTLTTGAADSNSTGVAASEVLVNIDFK